MKKITAFLLAVLLIAAGMFGFSGTTSKAASASFSVSIDNASAPVGSTITVTVTFNTDVQATASFSLAYDGNVLSPNSSTNGLFEDSATGTSQSISFTVTGSGSTAVTASGSGATLGSSPGPLPVSSGSASFSGTAASQPTEPAPTEPAPTEPAPTDPPATEPPTTPSQTPATEPPTPEPTVPTAPQPSTPDQAAIDASIAESIAESIRASEAEAESIRNSIAAAEAASREESLRAQDELNNTVPETTEEATEGEATETAEEETNLLETEQESAAVVALSSMLVDGKATTIDGRSLEMAESLEDVTLPDGYTLSNITLGDQVYEVAKGDNGLILYYLMDGEDGDFYLFDDDENVFYPFVSITSGSETYVILKPGKNIKIPGNLESVDLSIDGKPVSAWQPEENSDPSIYVVFAADSNGQRGFYRYNETDESLTPYSTANTSDGDTAASSSASAGQVGTTSSSDDSLFTILGVLGCVVAILIVALIIVLILRGRSRRPEGGGNDPDSDYEDDEDYEDDGLTDFNNPMFSDIQSEAKESRSSNKVSSDTMDLFDVQDIEPESGFDQKPSEPVSSDGSGESVSAADQYNTYSQPDSTDSMIDMEALSRALSDVQPEDTASSKPIGNTQKLEAINRELDEELSGSRNQTDDDDDDDFDVTRFDD